MELLKKELVVSKITAAVFVPFSGGTPVHKDRPTHGLAFSIDCSLTYRFGSGKVLHCRSGECIYLPKGAYYTVEKAVPPGPAKAVAGTYAINFLLLDVGEGEEPFVLRVRGKDEVLSSFVKVETAWRQKSVGFYEECFVGLYRLIRVFKREMENYSPLDHVLGKLAPALQYIEANYTKESISLAHLARLCGVSEPYLRKLFQAAFSVSPSVYMRNLRLNYAKELLRSGEYSITYVALLSGFNDTAYFSREFKKATGVSPNQYCQ